MRFNKAKRVELCVSGDATRAHLTQAHLDVENGTLVAANGSTLVVVPVEAHEDDVSGPIATSAIKHARKLAGRDAIAEIRASEHDTRTADGGTAPRDRTGGDFPPYERVLTKYQEKAEGFVTVALDVKLLWDIAQALGASKKDAAVVLTFPQDTGKLDPIQVRRCSLDADGSRGVLMPVRLPKEER